jgi:hypothetical protein
MKDVLFKQGFPFMKISKYEKYRNVKSPYTLPSDVSREVKKIRKVV